ncbi:MAG TPA: CoA transferase [Candidatus Sulfotelmatobacter sp.]|nr:CoA transferase [Candidatus Sulfotelmatobacter sp.]
MAVQPSIDSVSSQPKKALEGLSVLDFSHALAGPYCTLLLADYGADIYKLEAPQGGELSRGWGPPFLGGEAAFFLGLNRGKRGISIDLKQPEGIDLCLRLLDRMDILVENFRPGTMDRLGLGYEAVHARNPKLVYCSISGYGQNGPARDEAAMDLVVECSSGFMSITGTEDGEQVRSGYAVADINAGLFAVIGILMAIQHRTRTGVGQFVDVSMFDGMISAMSSNYMTYLGSGRVPQPLGTSFPTVVPYRVFHASDRVFSIAVGSEKLWSTFCHAIGHPEFISHPDYATNALRIQNRHALEQTLDRIFRKRTADEWIETLGSVGIPCSLVRTFAEVAEHPQAAVRQMFPHVEHSTAGSHRVTGSPIKMSETPGRPSSAAPSLGQHTCATLVELLGLDAEAIARLTTADVIVTAPHNKYQNAQKSLTNATSEAISE